MLQSKFHLAALVDPDECCAMNCFSGSVVKPFLCGARRVAILSERPVYGEKSDFQNFPVAFLEYLSTYHRLTGFFRSNHHRASLLKVVCSNCSFE